jgi:hypothetical protein
LLPNGAADKMEFICILCATLSANFFRKRSGETDIQSHHYAASNHLTTLQRLTALLTPSSIWALPRSRTKIDFFQHFIAHRTLDDADVLSFKEFPAAMPRIP